MHRCLHRALAQAVTWRLLAHNVATGATPPPRPHRKVVALAPEQVAPRCWTPPTTPPHHGLAPGRCWRRRPAPATASYAAWNGPTWTWTPARSGSTRRLTIIDPAVLPIADPSAGGRRKELAVGPVKSTASSAIPGLASVRCAGVRQHRRQQARLRLACGQPQTVPLRWVEPGRPPQPVQLDLVFRTERGRPINPNHASRAFARLAASIGLAAHPHMLRHAPASAMAANKEPASIIAAQLRHADGGALAQRGLHPPTPQTASRVAGLIEGVRPSGAGWASGVGGASGGGKPERNRSVEPALIA